MKEKTSPLSTLTSPQPLWPFLDKPAGVQCRAVVEERCGHPSLERKEDGFRSLSLALGRYVIPRGGYDEFVGKEVRSQRTARKRGEEE